MTKTQKSLLEIPQLLAMDWHARLKLNRKKVSKRPKKIIFIGTGSSYHVALWANWAAQDLFEGKIETAALTTWDFLAQEFTPAAGTLIVFISHRGNKGLTAKALLKAKRSMKILIAAEGAPGADFFSSRKETSASHTISLMGAICAVAEIFSGWLDRTQAKALTEQRLQAAVTLHQLMNEVREQGCWVPKGKGVLNFVGPGIFQPIALELALKSREMAKITGVGFGVEEILHGPLSGLKKQDTVVVLPLVTTPKRKDEEFLYLERTAEAVRRIAKTGAALAVPRFSVGISRQLHALPRMWQAVVYLYWGQWTLLAKAQKEGVNPDKNPFL